MSFFSSFYEKLYKIRFVFPLLFVIGSLVGFFAIYQQSLSLIMVGLIIAAISEILMAVFLIMSLILLRFRVVIAFALAMIASGIVFVYALQYLKEKNGKDIVEMVDLIADDSYETNSDDNSFPFEGVYDETNNNGEFESVSDVAEESTVEVPSEPA